MKNIVKKWWFWLIIISAIIIIIVIINKQKEKKVWETIGQSASKYYTGVENANSHINEFSYNYETGKAEYKSKEISLEMYNKISENMNEDDVISILGSSDGDKIEGENTYVLTWGDTEMKKGYWIQIIFSKEKRMISKSEVGLK